MGLGFKIRTDLAYMTKLERAELASMREAGSLSFFRVDFCACGAEVFKGKTACSEECLKKAQKENGHGADGDGETTEGGAGEDGQG